MNQQNDITWLANYYFRSKAIATKKLSSLEVTNACLTRMEKLSDKLLGYMNTPLALKKAQLLFSYLKF